MTQWSRTAPLYPGKDSRTYAIQLESAEPTGPGVGAAVQAFNAGDRASVGCVRRKIKPKKVPFGFIAPERWETRRRDPPTQKTYVMAVDEVNARNPKEVGEVLSCRSAQEKQLMPALPPEPEPEAGSPMAPMLWEQRHAFRAKRNERCKVVSVFPVLTKPEVLPEWEDNQSGEGEETKDGVVSARLTKFTVVSLRRQRACLKESEERQQRSEGDVGRWNYSVAIPRKDPPWLDDDDEAREIAQQSEEEPSSARRSASPEARSAACPGSLSPVMRTGMSSNTPRTEELREKGRRQVREMSKRHGDRISQLRKGKGISFAHFEQKIRIAGLNQRMKECLDQGAEERNKLKLKLLKKSKTGWLAPGATG